LVDLDDDGARDILSGSYSRMEESMAGLFQLLRGRADGTFEKAVPVTGADGEPLIIPTKDDSQLTEKICTRPTAVDWDSDGDLDLVVGNFAGGFYLFTGEGKGGFRPTPEPILAGDAPLKINGAHADPFLIDWDGDGDLDLLSGASEGGVYLAENVAGPGNAPELKPFQTLIEPGPRTGSAILRESDLTGPASATRVWADDVNSDGKLDLLVGDSVTLVSPAEGLSEERFQEKCAEWQEAFGAVTAELNAAQDDTKKLEQARQRLGELYQRRSEFVHEEMTGFVWLYLQK
jgi:hypothetical protein